MFGRAGSDSFNFKLFNVIDPFVQIYFNHKN